MGKNTRSPVELHKRILQEFATLTVDEAREIISEDLVIDEAAGLPFGGFYKGPEGFVALMRNVAEKCPTFQFKLLLMLDDGEENIMFHARVSGDAPGGHFDMPIFERWRFENDRAVEVIVCWHDTQHIAELFSSSKRAA